MATRSEFAADTVVAAAGNNLHLLRLEQQPGGATGSGSGGYGALHLNDVIVSRDCTVNTARWNRNNKVVASGCADGQIQLLYGNGRVMCVLPRDGVTPPSALGSITGLSWSTGSKRLAAGSSNGNVYVFDMQGKQAMAQLPGHPGGVTALEYQHEDKFLAVASGDGSIVAYPDPLNASKGPGAAMPLQPSAADTSTRVCLSLAAQEPALAAGSVRGGVAVWDVPTCRVREEWAGQHGGSRVNALQVVPVRSSWLYSAGSDGRVCLQDRHAGSGPVSALSVGAPATALMVKEDHSMIGVGTAEGVVMLYDPRHTRRPLHTTRLQEGSPISCLHWQHRYSTLASRHTTHRSSSTRAGVGVGSGAPAGPSSAAAAAAGAAGQEGSAAAAAAAAAGDPATGLRKTQSVPAADSQPALAMPRAASAEVPEGAKGPGHLTPGLLRHASGVSNTGSSAAGTPRHYEQQPPQQQAAASPAGLNITPLVPAPVARMASGPAGAAGAASHGSTTLPPAPGSTHPHAPVPPLAITPLPGMPLPRTQGGEPGALSPSQQRSVLMERTNSGNMGGAGGSTSNTWGGAGAGGPVSPLRLTVQVPGGEGSPTPQHSASLCENLQQRQQHRQQQQQQQSSPGSCSHSKLPLSSRALQPSPRPGPSRAATAAAAAAAGDAALAGAAPTSAKSRPTPRSAAAEDGQQWRIGASPAGSEADAAAAAFAAAQQQHAAAVGQLAAAAGPYEFSFTAPQRSMELLSGGGGGTAAFAAWPSAPSVLPPMPPPLEMGEGGELAASGAGYGLRDDIMAMHLDMLHQFQAQQAAMGQLVSQVVERNEALSAEVAGLRKQLSDLTTRRDDFLWL